MLLARQKYLNGAAEYLLFMWQMEDLLRAVHFDIDTLEGLSKPMCQMRPVFRRRENGSRSSFRTCARNGLKPRDICLYWMR